MGDETTIFAQFFELAKLEKAALLEENLDKVEEYCSLRNQELVKILASDNAASPTFKEKIVQAQQVHAELTELAEKTLASVRGNISNTRKQNQYFSGYQQAQKQANKSYYCDKQS